MHNSQEDNTLKKRNHKEFFPEDGHVNLYELRKYVTELEERLELSEEHPYDGIECRDESIWMLENALEKCQEECKKYIEKAWMYDDLCK